MLCSSIVNVMNLSYIYRYEPEFFLSVVNGHDIVSWAAVDSSRPDSQCDELIGFVTARIIAAKDSEIGDMFGYDSSRTDQSLVYILTLGVVEPYRNLGIASALIREVIKYAASMPVCRAVYLHGSDGSCDDIFEELIFIPCWEAVEN
ncbi:Histone acetyltransferase mcc1 [Asimina triloba]